MKRFSIILLAVSPVLMSACAAPSVELTNEDRAVITAMADQYLQALVDADLTALGSMFTDDGVRLTNDGGITHGPGDIEAINLGADFISFRIDNVTIEGGADLAYSWLDYDLTSIASEGAEPSTFFGRFLMVLEKQQDGSWLYDAVMFNPRSSP